MQQPDRSSAAALAPAPEANFDILFLVGVSFAPLILLGLAFILAPWLMRRLRGGRATPPK